MKAKTSLIFNIHPDNPQARLLREAVSIIQRGGVIVYPTDSGYALGCRLGEKAALERIRDLRGLDQEHHFTLVCRDLSELSTYAYVDNPNFRILRAYTPGAYTFLLKATSEVPKRLLHPKRKIIGIRVPDHPIALAILESLDEPLLSSTLRLAEQTTPLIEPGAIRDLLGKKVDLIIDGGSCGMEPTTVVDLTSDKPVVVRHGKGDPTPFL